MDGISKKTGVLMITVFMLILSAISVSAQPAQPESYSGIAYVGDVTAPSGTSVRATTTHYNGSSVTYSTTTNASGYYSLDIPVGNSDFPNGATSGASVTWYIGATAATACGTATPPTGSCTDVVTSGAATANWNLKIAASCMDGVLNQGEALIDCGGTSNCGACLSATSGISLSADVSTSDQNVSGTMTISSASTSSYTPSIGVTLVAGSLTNAANASDTITGVALSSSSVTLTYGASNSITVTVTIPGNKSGTYRGNISVYNDKGLSNSTTSVTLTVSEAAGVIRARRYMVLAASPAVGTEFCVNQPVSIYANDSTTGRELSDVHIDAIYNGVKVFVIATDSSGKATFTPNKVGIWNVTGSLHRYRDAEVKVNVKSCVVTTTTTTVKLAVTTTTVKPAVTTTVPLPPVTTVPLPPVTTVPKPPVTTTVPPVPPAPAIPTWLWIVVIIVIIVIIYLVAKKGKGGETPETK